MSKFIDAIIDEVRESTENEEFNTTIGLTEEEIEKFINEALHRLHSRIVTQHPNVFVESETQNIVANQEAYDINYRAFLGNKITSVEYSPTGNADDYYPLRPKVNYNRNSGADGDPDSYIRRSKQILINPIPTDANGKLRISYVRKPQALRKRRATIVSIDNASATAPDEIEINYVNGTTIDSTELDKRTRFSVCDKYGNITMANILISARAASDASNDAKLTIDTSNFTAESGETVAVGDYIISGEYSTSHFELGNEVERYIHAYVEWKMLKRDSSVDSQEAMQELGMIEQDIIASYADIEDDIMEIPEINDTEDWYI